MYRLYVRATRTPRGHNDNNTRVHGTARFFFVTMIDRKSSQDPTKTSNLKKCGFTVFTVERAYGTCHLHVPGHIVKFLDTVRISTVEA